MLLGTDVHGLFKVQLHNCNIQTFFLQRFQSSMWFQAKVLPKWEIHKKTKHTFLFVPWSNWIYLNSTKRANGFWRNWDSVQCPYVSAANCNLLKEWHALLLTIWDFLGIGAGGWIGTDMLVEGGIWDPAVSDAEEVSTVIKQAKN